MGFWDRLFRRDVSRAAPVAYTDYVSSYGMPSAEKIQPVFEQFAALAYSGNAVVFSVENRIISVFTEATFKYRNLSDKRLFGDPSLAKLERPWPNGSTQELLARMRQDAAFSGNAYIRDCGDRLERLRPDWVTIVSEVTLDALGNEVRTVVGYLYEPTGDPDRSTAFYPVDEVAHWSPIPDPLANFRGMSWLTPVIREINGDVQMAEYREAFFKNAATPNLIIKYTGELKPEYVTALRESIQARHSGSANAFGTLVLDRGADPMIVGANMEGSAFDKIQAATETRVAAAAGVPAVVAGLREGLQASQPGELQAAIRGFVDLTVRPLWRSACAALESLVPVPPGAQLWFDTSDVSALAQGEKDKADTLQQLATTMNTWIMAGFTPDSVIAAATSGDPSLLKHTGLISVQMQPLNGATAAPVQVPNLANPMPMNGKVPALTGTGG